MKKRFYAIKVGKWFYDYLFAVYTKPFGYICLHLPTNNMGFLFYFSPDGSVDKSTFFKGFIKGEAIKARLRKELVGHNYESKVVECRHLPMFEKEGIIGSVSELNYSMNAIFRQYGIF